MKITLRSSSADDAPSGDRLKTSITDNDVAAVMISETPINVEMSAGEEGTYTRVSQ